MAAATVQAGRRKRGAAVFLEEDPFAALPQLNTKRGRCSPLADVADLGVSMEFNPVDALQLIFPGADPQLLRGYFEASGNVLDAAIRGFKDYLASGSETTSADAVSPGATPDGPVMNSPTNGSEWAELIVKEMSSASDTIDAKNRAFKILELFDKSTTNCNTPDEKQKMREEHKILKQMLGGLLHQNGILKRAFLIQHNRLKDYQEMVQERSQFKEIVDRYQQQIETLEMHLKQAQQSNSMPGGGGSCSWLMRPWRRWWLESARPDPGRRRRFGTAAARLTDDCDGKGRDGTVLGRLRVALASDGGARPRPRSGPIGPGSGWLGLQVDWFQGLPSSEPIP